MMCLADDHVQSMTTFTSVHNICSDKHDSLSLEVIITYFALCLSSVLYVLLRSPGGGKEVSQEL